MRNGFFEYARTVGFLIGVGAACFASNGAIAQTADSPKFVDLVRATGLSSSQQSQVTSIVSNGDVALEKDLENLATVNSELLDLMSSSGAVVMANVEPILQKKEIAAAQVDHDLTSMRLQMRNVLTTDQLAKLQHYQQQLSGIQGQKAALLASFKQ